MLQNYNKWKVLQVFFDQPLAEGGLQLREISRLSDIAPPSVKNYLQELKKEQFIIEKNNRAQKPVYSANRDGENFRFYRVIDVIERIKQSGLLNEIIDKFLPGAVILFGSASRGEDTEHSDVDLFVDAKEKKINLKIYEKKLKRNISIFFEPNFNRLSKELKNNIINGKTLYGYLKVF